MFLRAVLTSSLLLATILAHPERARGQCLVQKLTTDDEAPLGTLGFATSVSVAGDWLVVTARYGNQIMTFSSAFAYVYQRIGHRWILDERLSPFEGTMGSFAVISDNIVAATSMSQQRVVVFRRNESGWVEETSVTPWDAPDPNTFGGYPIALNGGRLVVGAQYDNEVSPGAGAVYVFRRKGTEWIPEQKLSASDALNAEQGGFARELVVDGEYILVGNPWHARDDEGLGWVYVYRFEGELWIEEAILTGDETELGDQFGRSMAISGPRALIGGNGVLAFERKSPGWKQGMELAPHGAPALTDSFALIGDPGYNNGAGAAHLFSRAGSTWSLIRTIRARGNATHFERFGSSVALTDTHAIITSRHQEPGQKIGTVFVYALTGTCHSLLNYSGFQRCFSGTAGGVIPLCEAFDMDADEDVDSDDYIILLETFSGP